MNRLLQKCKVCNAYSISEKCRKCGSDEVASPHPARFSPDDRYLRYRVQDRYKSKKRDVKGLDQTFQCE